MQAAPAVPRGAPEKRAWGKAYVPRGMLRKEDPTVSEIEHWKVIQAGLRHLGEVAESRGAFDAVAADVSASGCGCISFDGIYREVVALVEQGRGGWLYEQLVETLASAVQELKGRLGSEELLSVDALVAMWEGFEHYAKRLRNLTSYLEVQWVRRSGVEPLLDVAHAKFVASILPTFLGTTLSRFLCRHLSLAAVLKEKFPAVLPQPLEGSADDGLGDRDLVLRAVLLLKQLQQSDMEGFLLEKLLLQHVMEARTARGHLLAAHPSLTPFVSELAGVAEAVTHGMTRAGLPGWAVLRVRETLLKTVLDGEAWATCLEQLPGVVLKKEVKVLASLLDFAGVVDSARVDELHERVVKALRGLAEGDAGRRRAESVFLPSPDSAATPPTAMALLLSFHEYIAAVRPLFPTAPQRDAVAEAELLLLNHTDAVATTCSRFLDHSVRAVGKGEASADALWKDFEAIYGLLQQKDHVEELCRRKLAARVLAASKEGHAAESAATETTFVSLFKLAQPASSSVRRMEEMLKDASLSAGEVSAWQATFEDGVPPPASFLILNTSAWPTFNSIKMALPASLGAVVTGFTEWYVGKHTGRTLVWNHAVGHASLVAHLDRKHDVSCGLVDASVLLSCFNAQDECSVEAIEQQLGVAGCSELRGALGRLVAARVLQHPAGEAVRAAALKPGDILTLNMTHKVRKIVVSKKVAGDPTARGQAAEALSRDQLLERKAQVEAAVVRIMKSRRTLHINDLVTQVMQQIAPRFKPEVSFIKKRIDDLLSRGFISRSESDRNFFLYEL